MTALDFIIIAVLGYNIFAGLKQGAVRMISGLIGVFVAVFIAKKLHSTFFESIGVLIPFCDKYPFLFYGGCFIGSLFFFQLLTNVVHHIFKWTGVGIVNHAIGCVLGFTRGVVFSLIIAIPLVVLNTSLAANSVVIAETKPAIDELIEWGLSTDYFSELFKSVDSTDAARAVDNLLDK